MLITDTPLSSRKHRQETAQILFETLNVPALYISIQATLALYAAGRTTGLVVDVGESSMHAVPIYEGFAINAAIQRVDLAGR